MFAYWALFGIFGLAAATSNERERRLGIVSWLAGGLLLTLMIGLRRNVGGDWHAYEAIFDRLRNLDFDSAIRAIDPSYTVLNMLAAYFGFDVWAVNLACALIFTYGLLRFCHDQPNPVLAVLVGIPYLVIVVAMGYTRQGAALGLVLLALFYYFRGAIVRMSICLALAVTFHKSAIIVIPLIALASSRRRVLTIALLAVTTGVTYWLFVSPSLDRLVANYIDARYSSSGAAIRIAMNLVPATLFLLFPKRFSLTRDERRLWTIFSLGSFVALLLLYTTPSSTAVDRVSLYLIPLQLFVLSRIPVAFSNGQTPSIAARFGVIAYSLAVQFIWLNYADNSRAWIPYDNYLTDLRA
jgi:hypothetical protein